LHERLGASSAFRPVVLSAALGAVLPAASSAQDLAEPIPAAASAQALAEPVPAAPAQDPAERVPNPRLEVDLAFGVALDRDAEGDISSAFTTSLGATFVSETPISVFRLSSTGSLRLPLDGADADGDRFDGPSIELAYRRQVPSATLDVSASYSQDDVDDLDLADSDEDDEGTQRRFAADVFLSLRDDRPLGLEFDLGIERLDYQDSTSADLVDQDFAQLASTVRLDFSEVLQARATARVSRTEEEGADPDTDLGFDVEASLARPDGRLFGRLSIDEADLGEVVALRVGRDIERPLGPISASLGVRRSEDGEFDVVGTLNVARDFPNGRLTVDAEQGVGNFDGDDGTGEQAGREPLARAFPFDVAEPRHLLPEREQSGGRGGPAHPQPRRVGGPDADARLVSGAGLWRRVPRRGRYRRTRGQSVPHSTAQLRDGVLTGTPACDMRAATRILGDAFVAGAGSLTR
jgi:hypothetical protein